jgi:HNH endonuclease
VTKPLDVHNGLLLSALWDAAFDKGLVSFADDGTALASQTLSETAKRVLGIETAPRLQVGSRCLSAGDMKIGQLSPLVTPKTRST